MKRALITGITGQDGSHLAEWLLGQGYEVWGLIRPISSSSLGLIAPIAERLVLRGGDLRDAGSLNRVVRDCRPHEVYNLGAQSFVPDSFEMPELTGEITGLGAARMLEAVRTEAPEARFYQASSSEMFGRVRETPQRATTPFHPRSPYGAAKAYAHWMTVNAREAYGLHASSGILFNHEGPRRGLRFVTRKITDAAARIKLGLAQELRLGNLDAQRDWGYAADYVRAMWAMLQRDQPGDCVVATGEAHCVRDWCRLAFEAVDLDWRKYVVADESLLRPAEVDTLLGDPAQARDELDWEPSVSFEGLVQLMVKADLDRHRNGSPGAAS